MSSYLIQGAQILGGDPRRTCCIARRRHPPRSAPASPSRPTPTSTPHGLIALPGLVDLHTHLREPGREDAETVADRHPRRGAWAASPPCTRWPTPTRSPTPPASSSRSGGSAARPATATCSRSARSPSGWPASKLAELGAMADSAAARPGVLRRRPLRVRRGADAPRPGVRQGVRRRRRPARPGAAADRGRPDERGRGVRRARPGRLAGGRRGGDHRPRRACSPRTSAPACTSATSPPPARWRSSAGPRPRAGTVTAEVTPHHLLLTDELVAAYDPVYKVNPPLRTARRRRRRCATALADGTIDAVATDHAPHPVEDKETRVGGRRDGHDRPGDRAVGGPGGHGRDRPARLGRRRRPDVVRARRGSAGCPATAVRSRSASPPTSSCRPGCPWTVDPPTAWPPAAATPRSPGHGTARPRRRDLPARTAHRAGRRAHQAGRARMSPLRWACSRPRSATGRTTSAERWAWRSRSGSSTG